MLKMESLALKILELEEIVKEHKIAVKNIHDLLYSMNGPLQNNNDGYNSRQLDFLCRLSKELHRTGFYFKQDYTQRKGWRK